jgi:hypothetical protein
MTFQTCAASPPDFDPGSCVRSSVAAEVTDGVWDCCGGSVSLVPVVDGAGPETSEPTVLMVLGRSEGMAVVKGVVWPLCVIEAGG